jgi:gamma-glutamyltranspeptidase/glutathione hydrolase
MTLDAASSQTAQRSPYAPTHTAQVIGTRWAVGAGHPLAAQAAARVLASGGNAIDAGVAGGLCLGVVHPDMVSVAGVAPILVHLAGAGRTYQVSGVGPYPRAATLEYFRDRCGGQIPAGLARTVVPASPDAWLTALERWGTMSFADVIAPALECAERGFPLSSFSAYQMAANAGAYRRWPTSAALYLRDGRALETGEILVQRELAETFTSMIRAERRAGGTRAAGVRAARDHFYKGDVARAIAGFHAANGGLMTYEDLASFEVEVAPALKAEFRDYEVATCGFWCQGPALLQMLNLIEPYDLAKLRHNSPAYLHLLIETVKVVFADRDAYYADPLHVKVPADGLLSKAYAEARRSLIRDTEAWPEMPPAGDPYGLAAVRNGARLAAGFSAGSAGATRILGEASPGVRGRERPRDEGAAAHSLDTSYIAVVDGDGNAFSATPSDPNVDSPVVPGVGCVVSPRGSQGWLDPAHPSVVAPGKRPRLTPAPAMAFRDGKVLMPFGTPGGDVQQQAMLQVFLNVTAFGMPMQQAVEVPRVASRSFPDSFWPHVMAPGKVEVEGRVPPETRDALAALGHRVSVWPEWEWRAGAVCGVLVAPDGARFGGADPRRGSHAIAW